MPEKIKQAWCPHCDGNFPGQQVKFLMPEVSLAMYQCQRCRTNYSALYLRSNYPDCLIIDYVCAQCNKAFGREQDWKNHEPLCRLIAAAKITSAVSKAGLPYQQAQRAQACVDCGITGVPLHSGTQMCPVCYSKAAGVAAVQQFCSNCGQPYLKCVCVKFSGKQNPNSWPQGGTSPNMAPNVTVRIWWDTSVSAYRMTSPYRPELVQFLKQAIPASDRSYAPDTKIWTFSEKYLDAVQRTIETMLGSKPQLVSRAQAEKAAQGQSHGSASTGSVTGRGSANPTDATIITFFRLLPYEAAQAAYRKAAMLMHPDRGGSMDKMSDLNACWSRLEKDLFARG